MPAGTDGRMLADKCVLHVRWIEPVLTRTVNQSYKPAQACTTNRISLDFVLFVSAIDGFTLGAGRNFIVS